jgi:hypothetical protein
MSQAFNLSQFANKVNTSGQASLTTAVTGTLPVANGGTGAASLTGNSVAITNSGGTALSTVAAGTTGNVLTSNGTTWISQAATGGQLQNELFTAPGTWTKPASCTQVKVTVIGGGGGGSGITNPQPSTTPGTPGGSSSFGPAVSATGGTAAGGGVPGTPGTGTVSVGTALKTFRTMPSGILSGGSIASVPGPNIPASPYSATQPEGAGAQGNGSRNGGVGGGAIAIVPVSAPVTITIGAGGNAAPNPGLNLTGGVGGAIVVEFVG